MVEYVDPNKMQEMQQLKQIEEMKKRLLSQILSKEAFERLGRVRAVNPETAAQAELYLLQIHQAGKLDGKVTDPKLKEIFRLLSGETRKGKIVRK